MVARLPARRTSSRRGWSADRSGRAHGSGCASAARWSNRSPPTATTTASTTIRRSRTKVGAKLDKLVRAPLIKADLWKGLPEFNQWAGHLQQLPSPALVHPVAFQSGGFDEAHPDFLPPDPRWGDTGDFNRMAAVARSLGQLVMPYLNVSWWDTTAPSVQALPSSVEPKDIAVQNIRGSAVTEQFGPHDGYIVSPHVPAVSKRIDGVFEEWKTDVPADCLFFDQIGARPWRRDFNPAAPTRSRTTTAGCRCSPRTPTAA